MGSIPEWVRSLGVGNGKLFQQSHLENPMDRGAWQAAVYGVAKSQTTLSVRTHTLNVLSTVLGTEQPHNT